MSYEARIDEKTVLILDTGVDKNMESISILMFFRL